VWAGEYIDMSLMLLSGKDLVYDSQFNGEPQGLVTIQVNILSMYKHIQGRTSFFYQLKPREFRTSVFFLGGAVTFTLGPCCSLLGRIPDKTGMIHSSMVSHRALSLSR
jgi:hypothetical protein